MIYEWWNQLKSIKMKQIINWIEINRIIEYISIDISITEFY